MTAIPTTETIPTPLKAESCKALCFFVRSES